jgi:hypothetical protein
MKTYIFSYTYKKYSDYSGEERKGCFDCEAKDLREAVEKFDRLECNRYHKTIFFIQSEEKIKVND